MSKKDLSNKGPSLTIITPVCATRGEYLSNLAASLECILTPILKTRLLSSVVWRIQVDGVEDSDFSMIAEKFADNPQWTVIVDKNGKQCGTPTTRNIAFAQTDTDLVWSIDEDDIVAPDVAKLFKMFYNHPKANYVVGGNISAAKNDWSGSTALTKENITIFDALKTLGNITPDDPNEWVLATPNLPEHVRPGFPRKTWRKNKSFPVLGVCAIYRTKIVQEVGGWPATPTGDDAALFIAVSDKTSGRTVYQPIIIYRWHDKQNTLNDFWTTHREYTYKLITNRTV